MESKWNGRGRGGPFLERLEERLLLSSGPLIVSSVWFEDLTASDSLGEKAATSLRGGLAIEEIAWGGETLDALADSWIVQFQADSLTGIASVGESGTLLSGGDVSFDVVRGLGMTGLVLIRTYGADVQTVSDWLGADADVAYFEPDAILQVERVPNDSSFPSLWGLNNTGQTGGAVDSDIDGPEAWDLTTGSSDVVIAVIDTGMDYTHLDLSANVWVNPGEIAGDGIDNDHNGYVDDVHGWDFAYGDSSPMDGDGHGTHVSGTIGAVGDNGLGVVGAAWNVKLMVLKFLDDNGDGATADAVLAVNYATMMKRDYGVHVVATNNSWGGGAYSSALRDAIAAAGQQDILFIAAAGNGGLDGIGDNNDAAPFYPASYNLDNIIAVASTNSSDQRASSSNYGATSVDLAAPGVSIYSTLPGNTYGYMSGTSMATPHVSGAAALLAALDPSASAATIKSAILAGVDPVSSMSGLCVTGGRLNAHHALQILSPTGPRVASISPPVSSPPVDTITVRFTEDILPASVVGGNFLLRDDGPDDVFDTADDTVLPIGDSDLSQPQGDTVTVSLGSLLPAEQYRLTLVGTGASPIRDTGGNALNGGADEVYLFEILAVEGPYGEISGSTWSDLDGDGVRDGDEPGAAGWTVYADLNGDGSLTPLAAETVDSSDVPVTIRDRRTVTSGLTVAGLVGTISDVNVTLNITHTYDSDLVVTLISPAGTRVELFNRIGGSGNNFSGTTLDDEAATPIGGGSAPFAGSYQPSGLLSDFDDEQANGTWQLEVADKSRLDTGTLNSWSITIITGEPSATTAADGGYVLTALPAGTYTVAQVSRAGWLLTHPLGGTRTVVVTVGHVTAGVDFGYVPPAEVVDRRVFYNHSSFDGGDPSGNLADDGAIAPDPAEASDPAWGKEALLPGETASFRSYTSYSKGLNGVMVDIAVLREPDSLSADDFTFLMGNTSDLADWSPAPAPQVVVIRPTPGLDHTYRVTLIWSDNAIEKTWLRVEIKANDHTGLLESDVFYFGNAIGESGDSLLGATVDSGDRLGARANPRGAFDPAPIDFAYDYNRDGLVDSGDRLIARANATSAFTALKLITAPGAPPPSSSATDTPPIVPAEDAPGPDPDPTPTEPAAAYVKIAATASLPQPAVDLLAARPDAARASDDPPPWPGDLAAGPTHVEGGVLDVPAVPALRRPWKAARRL